MEKRDGIGAFCEMAFYAHFAGPRAPHECCLQAIFESFQKAIPNGENPLLRWRRWWEAAFCPIISGSFPEIIGSHDAEQVGTSYKNIQDIIQHYQYAEFMKVLRCADRLKMS